MGRGTTAKAATSSAPAATAPASCGEGKSKPNHTGTDQAERNDTLVHDDLVVRIEFRIQEADILRNIGRAAEELEFTLTAEWHSPSLVPVAFGRL